MNAESAEERESVLYGEVAKMLFYKLSVNSGGLLAQCFECMRVCPIATQGSLTDPILRGAARRKSAADDA